MIGQVRTAGHSPPQAPSIGTGQSPEPVGWGCRASAQTTPAYDRAGLVRSCAKRPRSHRLRPRIQPGDSEFLTKECRSDGKVWAPCDPSGTFEARCASSFATTGLSLKPGPSNQERLGIRHGGFPRIGADVLTLLDAPRVKSRQGVSDLLLHRRTPCPASTIFAGWRQSVLPVHLLGLAPLLGSIGPVAGDVKLQDDGVVHDPVNRRGGGHGVGEDALPLREDQV